MKLIGFRTELMGFKMPYLATRALLRGFKSNAS